MMLRSLRYTILIPIFKKSNCKSPSNYRPISLTSIVCKVFESLIRNVVMGYLLTNGLLTREQHDFCLEDRVLHNYLLLWKAGD